MLIYSICCRNKSASLSISDVDHYVIIIGLCFKNTSDVYAPVVKSNANRMHLREKRYGGMERIHLAQDRKQWMALASTLMNFWVS
jgi:hypothetical protein